MSKTILVAFLTIAIATSQIYAQGTQETNAWRSLAEKLESSATISVRLKDGRKIKGTFLQNTSDALVLKPRTRIPVPARSIPFTDIESIERSKIGMNPAKKVLIGAGIGAGAIGLIFLAILAQLE